MADSDLNLSTHTVKPCAVTSCCEIMVKSVGSESECLGLRETWHCCLLASVTWGIVLNSLHLSFPSVQNGDSYDLPHLCCQEP